MVDAGWDEGTLVLGRYRLGPLAGRGGQGVVYEASDVLTGRRVAVKRVFRGQVRHETTALMAARFPGLVELLDQGEWGSDPTLVMAWVDGEPFPGALVGVEALTLVAQRVLDVLDRLHALGIVHRDLKPSNLRVGAEGHPVVLDLGLAHGDGVAWSPTLDAEDGTLRYIAPEQLTEGAVDPRCDLYALGVVLYEAASGELPHDGPDLLAKLAVDPIPLVRRGVPEGLFTQVVDRLVQRRPEHRFPDARSAARALGGLSTLVPPEGPVTVSTLRRWLRGPERVSRTRSLAAELLVERSEGNATLVREELARWERSGVISAERVLDPHRLRTLRAADRVSALVTAALQGSEDQLAEAVLASVDGLDDADATAALGAALFPLRHRADLVIRLLEAWEEVAFSLGTAAAFEGWLIALRRVDHPALEEAERVAEGALLVVRGEVARAEELVSGSSSRGAALVRLIAAQRGSDRAHEQAVEALEALSAADPRAAVVAAVARGTLLYRRLRFQEAADAHARALLLARGAGRRLAASMWEGASLLELPEPVRAARCARRTWRAARALDRVVHEGWAACLLRAATYRAGRAARPDHALVDDLEALGLPNLVAFAALTEAAFAWRAGRSSVATSFAERAERAARSSRSIATAVLAAALVASITESPPGPRAALAREARSLQQRGVGAQALRLLASVEVDPVQRETWVAEARERAWWTSALGVRREILSPAEVIG